MTTTPAPKGADIEPCPFCGGKASVQRFGRKAGGADYSVWCEDCSISTPWYHGEADASRAIAAWNRREGSSTSTSQGAAPWAYAMVRDGKVVGVERTSICANGWIDAEVVPLFPILAGAAPGDALDAAQSKPDFIKCATYGDYFVALRSWEKATGLVSKAGAIAASTTQDGEKQK